MAPKRPVPKPRRAPSEEEEIDEQEVAPADPPLMLHQLPDLPDDPEVQRAQRVAQRLEDQLNFEDEELVKIENRLTAYTAAMLKLDGEAAKATKARKATLMAEATQLTSRHLGDRRARLTAIASIGRLRRELLDAEDDLEASVEIYHRSTIVRAPRTPSATTGETPKRPRASTQGSTISPTPPRAAKKKKSQRIGDSEEDESPAKSMTTATSAQRYGPQGDLAGWQGNSPEWRGVTESTASTIRGPARTRGVSGGTPARHSATQQAVAPPLPLLGIFRRSERTQYEVGSSASPAAKGKKQGVKTPADLPANYFPPMARDAEYPCARCKEKGLRCYFLPPTPKMRKARCGRCNLSHGSCPNGKSECFNEF